MNSADLTDSIRDVPDTIVNELIQCESCKRAYRIVPSELAFLRQTQISLPRLCVNCRLVNRFERINKPIFHHRRCDCLRSGAKENIYKNTIAHTHGDAHCPNEFETAYAPDRPEIVYCEDCYNKEVS